MIVEPWLAAMVEGFMDPRWLYGVRSLAALAAVAVFARGYDWGDRAELGWYAVAVTGGVGVFGLWILLDLPYLTVGEADPWDPMVAGSISVPLVAMRLLGSALVVPVVEELFWRSFLMRWLHHPRFVDVPPGKVSHRALVISSLVFATEHRLWFAGLLAGLVYGEIYRRSGDLRVVILAHAVTNAALGVWVLGTGAWGFW